MPDVRSHNPNTDPPRATAWGYRSFVFAAIAAYLLYLGVGLYWHVVGDTAARPTLQYFVTWDMFPGYRSTGRRIVVLGETESGRFLALYPSDRQRSRSGLYGDLTRIDALAEPYVGLGGRALEHEIAATLAEHRDADDPVRTVYVIEETWPAKFNLPTSAYRRIALDGDPPTGTRNRRLVLFRPASSFALQFEAWGVP